MDKMKRVFSLVLVLAMLVGSFSSFSTVAFAEEAKKEEVKVEEVKKEETKEETKTEEVKKEEVKEVKVDDTKVLNNVPKDVIGTEYEAAVTRLVAFGVIGGYPDGTYKPEEEINRAQFSKIMVMALGLNDAVPAAQNKATGFSDVQAGYWAAGYINVASGQGLLKGYPDGTFRPANKVSYAESLTMLVRALGYQDEFLPGNWPGNYVAKAAEVGITKDVKMPGDAKTGAKRGPVAQMVNNTFDAKVVKVDKYKPNTKEVEYYETDITLLKDKLEISKYENTRVIADKIVDDGLAKDELRVRFLESVDRYGKNDSYNRGEVVKRAYTAGDEDTYRFNEFVAPRAIIGEEATTYVNDNDKIVYIERENDDKAYFDYVEKVKDGKLSLVALDKDVKFDDQKEETRRRTDRATVNLLKSKDDKFEILDSTDEIKDLNEKGLDDLSGRMGKFVIKNNRIVYAEILESAEAKDFMVVMKNDKGLLEGINGTTSDFKKDLRDDKDYDKALVHDTNGNEMSIEDIKEGNVLYIDQIKYDGDDVANVVVVKDNKLEGEMGRVKTDRVEIAGKETKVTKYETKNNESLVYAAKYAVNDFEDIREWMSSEWEDDMEDAYKETIIGYKDGAGRIAFLTTKGAGQSGYKFGIVTRTYADGDRIRVYTTIDGKDGKDQIFKADKELDVVDPFVLDENGKETNTRYSASSLKGKQSVLGSAVKFRLNSEGEITKEKLFIMPADNLMAMRDDFGKDIIKAKKVNNDKAVTFAVNTDSTTVIDAATAPEKADVADKSGNLDGMTFNGVKVDIDDFEVATWKDIKEDKENTAVRFFVFPKSSKLDEVDGLVFVGKEGANTGSDEIAVYTLDVWKTGDKVKVEYVSYENNTKQTREVDNDSKLVDEKQIKKEKAYVGKEKSNGKIALYGALDVDKETTKDFTVYRGLKVNSVDGNYIKTKEGNFLTSGSLMYDEDRTKSVSYYDGKYVDVVVDGLRARVVGISSRKQDTTGETDDNALTAGQYIYDGKAGNLVILIDKDGKQVTAETLDGVKVDDTVATVGDVVKVEFKTVNGKNYISKFTVDTDATNKKQVAEAKKEANKAIANAEEVKDVPAVAAAITALETEMNKANPVAADITAKTDALNAAVTTAKADKAAAEKAKKEAEEAIKNAEEVKDVPAVAAAITALNGATTTADIITKTDALNTAVEKAKSDQALAEKAVKALEGKTAADDDAAKAILNETLTGAEMAKVTVTVDSTAKTATVKVGEAEEVANLK